VQQVAGYLSANKLVVIGCSNSWKVKALREVKLQFWPGAKSVRAGIPTDAEVWAAITCVRIPTRR